MTAIYWIAHYENGEYLEQNGAEAGYPDIDRDRLVGFGLYRGEQLIIMIDFTDDTKNGLGPKRLIWRRRSMINNHGKGTSVHLAGWQREVNGKNVQCICYVSEETGGVLLAGEWQESRPFMHSISPLEVET